MNSEYRSNPSFSGVNSFSGGSNYDNKMTGSGKFGNIMEGYSSRNSSFQPQRQQMIPRSNMRSQSVFQHRGPMSMGHQMNSSASNLSGSMSKSGTSFFSSFGSDARSHFKSTFSAPLENDGPPMGSHPMDGNNRRDFMSSSSSSSSSMFTRPQNMGSSHSSYTNINPSKEGPGKQHFGRHDVFEPSYRQHESNMFGHQPTNRFDSSANFGDDPLPRKAANGLGQMNLGTHPMSTKYNRNSKPSGKWRKGVLKNGYKGKKRFNTSQGPQASKNRVPAAKASNSNPPKTNTMGTNKVVSSCSDKSPSTNQESTPEESCGELAEKNRVSALKRLGPKLSIVDRLGNKVSKKSVASEDEKVVKKSDTDEKKDTKTPERSSPITTEKVICPHCGTSGTSREDYSKHLAEGNHAKAMKQLKYRLMVTLNNMRSRQKAALDEMEKKEGFVKTGAIFCKTCKIIHHSKRVEHIETELHKSIEKFLRPNCTLCNAEFQSPMAFETHNSTYNHLKNISEDESSQSALESEDLNMEDLVTVDEVGVVDDTIGGGMPRRASEEEKVEEKPTPEKSSVATAKSSSPKKVTPSKSSKVVSKKGACLPKEKPRVELPTVQPKEVIKAPLESETEIKTEPIEQASAEEEKEKNGNDDNIESEFIEDSNSEIPMGTSFIRRVEILFCDVCMQFLPEEKLEMFDSLILSHCKSESHQIAFIEMTNKMNDKDFAFNEDELDYEPDENE